MLHHVSLEVPQQEIGRTVEFWGLLGFEPVEPPEPIAPYVTWLEREATQVHLIHSDSPTIPVVGHPAVVAPDFEQSAAALRDAGFEVEEARELWGSRRAFAIAPGGHRVELMETPPGTGA